MAPVQLTPVSNQQDIAAGAASFRRYLIAGHLRFAAFWSTLLVGGVVAGIASFRAELYGFAFSGLVGALAASLMVWTAIIRILAVRGRSDRRFLFLPNSDPEPSSGDKPSTEASTS